MRPRLRRSYWSLPLLLTAACSADRAVAPVASSAGASRAASPALSPSPSCPAACVVATAAAKAALVRASAGLTYMSETDAPFDYVRDSVVRRGPVDDALIRAAFGVAAGTPVESVTLDDFFARHIEDIDPNDPVEVALVPRYRALKWTVRAVTGATRVYRVGTIRIRCYLVGVDAWGHVFGLATTAVET